MPVVEGRSRNEPFKRAEAETNVGVDEKAPCGGNQRRDDGDQAARDRPWTPKPQNVDRNQGAEPAEYQIHGVRARVNQEIDFLGAVVDGMETPEKGNFMAHAMGPVV